MNRKSLRRCSFAMLSVAFGLACSLVSPRPAGAPPTLTPPPAPIETSTPVPNYEGVWSGTTSQGKPISFVVEGDAVTTYSIQAEMQGVGCSSKVESTIGLNAPIVDRAFEDSTEIGDATHVIQGSFDSDSSASGTLQYAGTVGCSGRVEVEWTATKGSESSNSGSAAAKAGQWAGEPAVSFQVGEDGQMRDFHIEIEIPLSGTCTVDMESVEVAPDGTFSFRFGDTDVEDANVIQGKFDGQTSASGTYSQALFCVNPETGQGVMSLTADKGAWSAEWTTP